MILRPAFRMMMRGGVLGRDVAGVVGAVGDRVKGFAVGDRVCGEASGAWADQVVVPASALVHIPDGVSMAEAAQVPVGGTTAMQCLKAARLQPGQRLVVLGASGGVGHLLVQLARAQGIAVTGVCSGRYAEALRELGCEAVVDRHEHALPEGPWDAIIDFAGAVSVSECVAQLAPTGRLVSSAGSNGGPWLGPLPRLVAVLLRGVVDKRVCSVAASPDRADMDAVLQAIAAGEVRPQSGRTLRNESVIAAFDRVMERNFVGRTLLQWS